MSSIEPDGPRPWPRVAPPKEITMQQLMSLQPGDILPCVSSGQATVMAEDVPVFRGTFGVSHGQQAVQIDERVARSKLKAPDVVMLTRRP